MPTMSANGLPTPAATDNYMENGRLYHGFRRGMYMYPCDEDEKDRMDIYHKIFEVARNGALHVTPIVENDSDRARILDLGCGTGIWAIDMADKYQRSEVVGLDLANIQPDKIPPNLRFRVPRDYEGYWSLGECSWDLIHIQMACGSVSSWPELYQKVFAHLKPGVGHIEQVEIDLRPRCDDDTLSESSPLVSWYKYLSDATGTADRPIAYRDDTKALLQRAGFIDIREQTIRAPINAWSTDPHQREIGKWYNLGLSLGLEALSLAAFTRVNNWNHTRDITPFLADVKAEMCKKGIHAYNNIHIITARKPQ